ncbi:hypothetical protein ABZ929_05960 [Streptomyces physcomitrii]|uniref:hypothetical protein n=1 Tax=Streptomyces physcomitrii TaxID=2724184 RepID=UPI003402E356
MARDRSASTAPPSAVAERLESAAAEQLESAATAHLEEAFRADLQRVEALRQSLPAAVRPSLRELAAHTRRGHNTLNNWLTGRAFPADADVLAEVVARIRQSAAGAVLGAEDTALLDPHRWRERHAAVNRARVRDAEELRRGRQAAADLTGAEDQARLRALPDPPRRLGLWTAAALRVHPSISGDRPAENARPGTAPSPAVDPGSRAHPAGFVLPAYVPRPHDDLLREALTAAAAAGEPALVVVRGGSCTGKTRAAYEAVRTLGHETRAQDREADTAPRRPPAPPTPRTAPLPGPTSAHVQEQGGREGEREGGGGGHGHGHGNCGGREPAPGPLTGWNLLFPRTAASALQALEARAFAPRTVVWLDDAHQLLADPKGEPLAAGLLSRLAGPGPLIVLATLWEAAFAELTAPPRESAFAGQDPHHHARALLTGATAVVRVPPAFGTRELRALGALGGDPALAAARRTSRDGKITQTLAAGLPLVDRYESAEEPPACYARALVTAAMDACRLGWDAPLPDAFLRTAAPGYLSAEQRAAAGADWFPYALDDARTRVQRVVAALEPVATADGMGIRPGVSRLADYLDAHGRAGREGIDPPESFWAAAAEHATRPGHLARLSREAELRSCHAEAEHLAHRAAEAGDPQVYGALAELRERGGDRQGAERLARSAAEAGDPYVHAALAWLAERSGDPGRAERLARLAANAGDPDALRDLTESRERSGDQEGAERLARLAAAAGVPRCAYRLAALRERAGDRDAAARLYRLAADAGSRHAARRLTELREAAGDRLGAEQLAREAAESGNPRCYSSLAWMRERAGDHRDAARLYRLAAESGDGHAPRRLAELRSRVDTDTAEHDGDDGLPAPG